MWKTFAPIVAGLGLFLALPALAAEKSGSVDCVVRSPEGPILRAVVLKGILRHERVEEPSNFPFPGGYWKVIADGKTYYLDLRGKELLERAENLVNQRVVVTGIPEPASPTIRVTSLKPDEFVKETIKVEIRGRLESIREWLHLLKEAHESIYPPREHFPIITGWQIYVGDKSYRLDFGSRIELQNLAHQLDHKGVIITGTRVGDVIHVTKLKADEGTYQQTVTVEIQGVLTNTARLMKWLEAKRNPMLDKDDFTLWYVTANGKSYQLDFSRKPMPFARLNELTNRTVVVTGTLKDGVVTVTSLTPVDPIPPSIAGTWDSTYGPVTIQYARGAGHNRVRITGTWVQGPSMVGVITSGTFDPVNGVLEFTFDEPWHNQSGTAVFRLSADGNTLTGTWSYTSGGGGKWVLTRPNIVPSVFDLPARPLGS